MSMSLNDHTYRANWAHKSRSCFYKSGISFFKALSCFFKSGSCADKVRNLFSATREGQRNALTRNRVPCEGIHKRKCAFSTHIYIRNSVPEKIVQTFSQVCFPLIFNASGMSD